MRLITIVSNTGNQLIAEQRPQTVGFLLIVLSLGIVGLAVYFARVHAYKMLLLPVLALLLLLLLSRTGQKATYRVTIDQAKRRIISEKLQDGKVLDSTTTSAADVASAEMEFNRGARKIALIHRDGHQSFPLGEEELQNEPDQYIVLNALRQSIGQTPATPQ